MDLRFATTDDLPLLLHWGEQAHVYEVVGSNEDWAWESELQRSPDWRELLIAELDGRPLGFVQIIDPALEESHYWGDVGPHLRAIDIWIGEASDLGKGYGTQMMGLALARCFADLEVEAVLVDPVPTNIQAHRFYERLGFRFLEQRKLDGDDCAVFQIPRTEWER